MNKTSKIYIAGHRGLAGSAIVRELQLLGYTNLLTRSHAELELTEQSAVNQFFATEKPDYVFLAAAKVGGIHANNAYPAEFIFSNLAIQTNIIHAAYQHQVKRLLFLGSSCIYPRDCPQPIKEEYLLTGPLELTNRPYAIAKIAGVEMCHAYNRQYGTQYLAAMPTNLYGPGDNYDLANSHVLPALIRKIHQAKAADSNEVVLWGSGTPRREFLYVDDLANACVFLMNLPNDQFSAVLSTQSSAPPLINIGTGEDLTIRALAETIAEVVGYTGKFVQDTSKPDGTMQKVLDVSRLKALGWQARTDLMEGINLTYKKFSEAQT